VPGEPLQDEIAGAALLQPVEELGIDVGNLYGHGAMMRRSAPADNAAEHPVDSGRH
jgi:hypothetical protein